MAQAAGQLRERITVLTEVPRQPDGQGGWLAGGVAIRADAWARVQALSGKQQLALGAVATSQVYTVTVRANGPADVAPGARLEWRGATLRVQSHAPGQRRDVVVLTCFDDGRH